MIIQEICIVATQVVCYWAMLAIREDDKRAKTWALPVEHGHNWYSWRGGQFQLMRLRSLRGNEAIYQLRDRRFFSLTWLELRDVSIDNQAEAELLSAIVAFFSKLGITSSDVGIKISNRKVSWCWHHIYHHHSLQLFNPTVCQNFCSKSQVILSA